MTKNIPFIHNYCDRWCERCPFTSRCGVFETERKLTDEEKDISNDAFWKKLSEDFNNTMKMLVVEAKEYGYNFKDVPAEVLVQSQKEMVQIELVTKHDELIRSVKEYSKQMKKLLEETSYWVSIATALAKQTAMGARDADTTLSDIRMLDNCRDVLSWYLYFLDAKFRRAVSGKIEGLQDGDLQSDWNGSAKIAMIGVDRSLHALTKLFEFTSDEDKLLPILSQLERIQKLAKQKFPDAEKFIRPGFDTEAASAQSIPLVI